MDTCKNPHRYDKLFAELPEDQSHPTRHKCAGCAYDLGYKAGLSNDDPSASQAIGSILKSQAGKVRHKSPKVAYYQGFTDGLNEYFTQHPES